MYKNHNLRLGATIWLAAMVGVIIISTTLIPQMAAKNPPPFSTGILIAISMVQSGVLIALATWCGVAIGQALGFRAPTLTAALSGGNVLAAFKPQILPALVSGILVGGLLIFLAHIAPPQLLVLGQEMKISLAAKLLYGGVTEEVLMRLGLMTALVWLPWRLVQKRAGLPRTAWVVAAIIISALLFGVLHLPAAVGMGASLTAPVVTYIIVGNTLPGILFGFLYWRYGIESAIIAHALAHAVATMVLA